MRKLAALVVIMLMFAACSEIYHEPVARRARAFVSEMNGENFAEASALGNREFRSEVGVRGLQSLWLETAVQAGSPIGISEIAITYENGRYLAHVTAEHNNRYVVWTLEFGAEYVPLLASATAGVRFRAAAPPEHLPQGIIEEVVVVGEHSGYPLDARLTLPADIPPDTQIPAVVLVHGFGPWDMDGSVFDNKPFRDIAWHLAGQGIAVLRYDKITHRYPDELYNFFGRQVGFELESVFDAGWARLLLLDDWRIDQNRVYVLGHGFGGGLAPMIAEMYSFNGWISMAGTPRNPLELAMDARVFRAVSEGRSETYLESLRTAHEQAAQLFFTLAEMEPVEAAAIDILGINGYFLRSLLLNPPVYFMENELPAMIIQGTNDFEVFFDRDFEMFKAFLSHNPNTEFRIYEGLNHLLMWSTMQNPDKRDYKPVATVETRVLDDIVQWLKRD